MNPDKVVVHVVDRQRCGVILDFFREGVRQSGEAPHVHPHREVLAFDVAGADVVRVRVTDLGFLLAADALRRGVAHARPGFIDRAAVELHQDGVINIALERGIDGEQVQAVSVRRKLNAIRKTALKIVDEVSRRVPVTVADHPGANQLCVGIHRDPHPSVTSGSDFFKMLLRDVLLLGSDKRPDFITLNSFALKVYKVLVQVLRTGRAQFNQQFRNRVFGNPGHANRRTDRIALDQRSNHLSLFLGV
jgi:hypothetical protein